MVFTFLVHSTELIMKFNLYIVLFIGVFSSCNEPNEQTVNKHKKNAPINQIENIIYTDTLPGDVRIHDTVNYVYIDTIMHHQKIPKNTYKGDIAINKDKEGMAILNNMYDSVKLLMIKSSGEKMMEKWLENGDFLGINYQKINTGKYSIFISGKYDEVLKEIKIEKKSSL